MKSLIENYKKLNPPAFNIKYGVEFFPKPSDKDYKKKSIVRYFIKKINDNNIIEVSYENWENISFIIYERMSLEWMINGPRDEVEYSNVKFMKQSEKLMPGIKNKLINPLQFYKP